MYPHERSLVKKMENKPFALLGINSDQNRDQLKDVIKKEKMTWRSWFDGPGTSGPIATQFKVHGWPTLYVVDHEGTIRHKWVGSPGGEVLDKAIEELVAKADKGSKSGDKSKTESEKGGKKGP
jgi:hypothetical protein